MGHFLPTDVRLVDLLEDGEVVTHSLITGELACGQLAGRRTTLALLHALPRAPEASPAEVLSLIEHQRLLGLGLGIVDVHLLAAARLAHATLWTKDRGNEPACEAATPRFIARGGRHEIVFRRDVALPWPPFAALQLLHEFTQGLRSPVGAFM